MQFICYLMYGRRLIRFSPLFLCVCVCCIWELFTVRFCVAANVQQMAENLIGQKTYQTQHIQSYFMKTISMAQSYAWAIQSLWAKYHFAEPFKNIHIILIDHLWMKRCEPNIIIFDEKEETTIINIHTHTRFFPCIIKSFHSFKTGKYFEENFIIRFWCVFGQK